MLNQIKNLIKNKKISNFKKQGFSDGSLDVLVLLSTNPVFLFDNPDIIVSQLSEYMIAEREAEKKVKTKDKVMLNAYMSGYNNAFLQMGLVIKMNIVNALKKEKEKACIE